MIYNLFGFDYVFELETFRQLLYVFILGLLVNIIFSFFLNQYWLKSVNSLFVSGGLVLSVYIITKVVSTNIALSLGLVGALSIVRFRTPIKNPFELIYYFVLIAFGIVSSVNLNLSMNLFFFMIIAVVIFRIMADLSEKFNILNYSSFDEKEYILSVTTNNQLDNVMNNKNLISMNAKKNENFYQYIFSSNNKNDLIGFLETTDDSKLISYSIDKRNNFNI